MLCLTLLSLLAVTFATDVPYQARSGGYGPDIKTVEDIIASAEEDLRTLQSGISSAATLCSVGADRLQVIREKVLPALNLKDEQQNALIQYFKDLIKDLQHRTDAAQSTTDGAKRRAVDTATEIAVQAGLLNNVAQTNDNQDNMINHLNSSVTEWDDFIVQAIDDSIIYLESNLNLVRKKVAKVHEYVEERQCEYGFFHVNLGYAPEDQQINFQTVFNSTPEVAVTLAGFSAHLDVGYPDPHEYSVLSVDKYVQTGVVTPYGFIASAVDQSKNQIDVKTVYCVYMACQGIGGTLDLAH